MYIYAYVPETERASHRAPLERAGSAVGFQNFSLRIFNSRVSNPDKLIVDVCLTRCRISMCQGLGPKKHDEISEIDRSYRCLIAIVAEIPQYRTTDMNSTTNIQMY